MEHVGACPYITKFFEVQKKREEQPIKTAIYTDSTLRLAQSGAMRADAHSASGSLLSEIVNVVYDDISAKKLDTVILMPGANDVLDNHERLPTRKDFAHHLTKSLVKLVKVGKRYTNAKFVLVPPPFKDEELTPEQEFFNYHLDKLCKENDQFDSHNVDPSVIERDNDQHPTENSKRTILQQLHSITKDLIIDSKFSAQKQWFRGVKQPYKWGCASCWQPGKFYSTRCEKCLLESSTFQCKKA